MQTEMPKMTIQIQFIYTVFTFTTSGLFKEASGKYCLRYVVIQDDKAAFVA